LVCGFLELTTESKSHPHEFKRRFGGKSDISPSFPRAKNKGDSVFRFDFWNLPRLSWIWTIFNCICSASNKP
jgi:hypothetical protein